MNQETKLSAQARQETGSGAMNRLRKQGLVPGVIYGPEKEPIHVQFSEHDFSQFLRHHTSENVMLDVEVENADTHKVLIREVQHHPLTGRPIHADFYELSMTRTVNVDIPIELVGEPAGVTQQGGVLEQLLRTVEVECLPGDIVEQFELDVSALEIGDRLAIKDLPIDRQKYEILVDDEVAVAAVAAPRIEEEVVTEEAAEALAEGAEPERIGEKPEGEEAEEGAEEKKEKKEKKEKE